MSDVSLGYVVLPYYFGPRHDGSVGASQCGVDIHITYVHLLFAPNFIFLFLDVCRSDGRVGHESFVDDGRTTSGD